MSVSVGSHHFKDSVVDGEQGHVKCTTAKIKDEDVLLALLLVQTICNSRSCPVGGEITKSLPFILTQCYTAAGVTELSPSFPPSLPLISLPSFHSLSLTVR